MPDLLNVQGLTAGYGEAIVLSDVTSNSPRARRSLCSAATAWARPRWSI